MKQNSNFQISGNSLALQWLGLGAFTAGAWVQSLVRELRSRKSSSVAKGKTKTKPNQTPSFQMVSRMVSFLLINCKLLELERSLGVWPVLTPLNTDAIASAGLGLSCPVAFFFFPPITPYSCLPVFFLKNCFIYFCSLSH